MEAEQDPNAYRVSVKGPHWERMNQKKRRKFHDLMAQILIGACAVRACAFLKNCADTPACPKDRGPARTWRFRHLMTQLSHLR
jgi:hypothetical protein